MSVPWFSKWTFGRKWTVISTKGVDFVKVHGFEVVFCESPAEPPSGPPSEWNWRIDYNWTINFCNFYENSFHLQIIITVNKSSRQVLFCQFRIKIWIKEGEVLWSKIGEWCPSWTLFNLNVPRFMSKITANLGTN